eukprot:scaffold1577_cov112-Isochrysis_galbana.AAC.2
MGAARGTRASVVRAQEGRDWPCACAAVEAEHVCELSGVPVRCERLRTGRRSAWRGHASRFAEGMPRCTSSAEL